MENDKVEILLVEDNPNDVELTLHALNKNHLTNRIHVVRDGEEALNFFFGDPTKKVPGPKVILLDLKLPKIDGMEVLRRLKNDPDTKAIPVVVLTSSNEERDILETYKLGVNSYIVKPVDFVKFVEAMHTLGMYWLMLNRPFQD
jgi:two-component system, response regulator